ncbi:hypothetical protein CEXT_201941 [Caerostris extrusa]|uniref:Uncharacterized protein n=1 Tax=Caerostris extrusa TaxID=172846 RepID=A0AAV4T6G8_CAEEX|nr:hypothetical protein CEXT_201941 [Caerostris extrusa]
MECVWLVVCAIMDEWFDDGRISVVPPPILTVMDFCGNQGIPNINKQVNNIKHRAYSSLPLEHKHGDDMTPPGPLALGPTQSSADVKGAKTEPEPVIIALISTAGDITSSKSPGTHSFERVSGNPRVGQGI